MKVTVERIKEASHGTCLVEREPGDPTFRNSDWGTAESRFLHHVKLALIAQGHDLIKKRMWKDGHMVSEEQQYLRTRNPKSPTPHVYVVNDRWAICDAGSQFNEDGQVVLQVHFDVFKEGV